MFMRLLKYIFLVTVTLIILPKLTDAQINFSIFPEKFDLELSGGEIYQDEIKIFNQSNISLKINIKVMNFSAAGEKGEMSFKEGEELDPSYNPSSWIKFGENNFILKEKELKKIPFSIEVPKNAEVGGHYAVALFQATPFFTSPDKPLQIIPTLGSIFLIKIKGDQIKYPPLEKQIELVNFNFPSFVEKGPILINFRIKNNDPVHVRVGGKLIIYNFFGRTKEEIKIPPQTILPQKIRLFEIKTNEKFFLGPYQTELILATETWQEKIGHQRQLVKKINFFALPWKVFLIFFLLLGIIFLILRQFYLKKR